MLEIINKPFLFNHKQTIKEYSTESAKPIALVWPAQNIDPSISEAKIQRLIL